MDRQKKLESRLIELDRLIKEAEARLGAHSVKPVLMQQLFVLEEERDAIVEQLNNSAQQHRESDA